jgi:polygalacturonase
MNCNSIIKIFRKQNPGSQLNKVIMNIIKFFLFPVFISIFLFCSENITASFESESKPEIVLSVKNFGATGDGITDDTPSINNAIIACSEAGGGIVAFPTGIYMTNSIHLMSNIAIRIDSGAVIKSMNTGFDHWESNQFDENVMDRAYYHIQASMFWGENLSNIKFTGKGLIDAGGLTTSSTVKPGQGDKVIALRNCRNIEITDLSFDYKGGGGAHYVILLTGCDSVKIDNLNLKARRDGINLMNSSNVSITNTQINSVRYEGGLEKGGDDAIKIGSDYSLGEIRPTSNIFVKNCTISAGCNGIMFGTETLGPISNCIFEDIQINFAGKSGLGITSNDGSIIENLTYKNIIMKNVLSPFFIKVSDVKRVPSSMNYETGRIKNILFENITATDIYNSINGEMTNVIWGKTDYPIVDITFRNVSITVKGSKSLSQANIYPPENDERFPQKLIKDILKNPFPSYGYYLRHIKNVQFVNCRTSFEVNDDRPAFIIDDGSNVGITGVSIQKGIKAECFVEIRNTVHGFLISNCPGIRDVSGTITSAKF